MPNLTRLQAADYMAMTRAMDTNRNNRVDANEANISWNAHDKIGNQNGVAGTREMANALAKGDVFMTGFSAETADKIAEYFSKRNENFDKPVAEWISDAWISKEDFEFEPAVRTAVDSNGDNRISKKEFAAALASGALKVGEARQVSQNPFTQPAQPSHPTQNNPFKEPAQTRPPSNNPFQEPVNTRPPSHNPFTDPVRPGDNPFRPIPDSGAYLKIEMVRSMSSNYEKTQILSKLAAQTDLSPREQVMLAETAGQSISDAYSKTQILQTLAQNRSLSEDGAIKVLKVARDLSAYNKSQVLASVVNSHKLAPQAQQSAIITATTLSGYDQTQALLNIIRNQDLHPQNKEFLIDSVRQHVSSDYDKRQILDALF